MSFSSVGFVYVDLLSDDNFLKLRLWMCWMDCFISTITGSFSLLLVLLQLVWRCNLSKLSLNHPANLNRKHFKLKMDSAPLYG